MSRTSLAVLALALLTPATAEAGEPSRGPSPRLKLLATLVALPRTPPCESRVVRVTGLYRVERILEGRYTDRTIPVVQRCPEMARGTSRHGQGDAGPLRPGQTHLLLLRPWAADGETQAHDPFADDKRPRYEALQTDRSEWPPRIVVVVSGGGGTQHRLPFDAGEVTVGRATDADVLLSDRAAAPRHLLLSVQGDRIEARALSTSGETLVNGKALTRPRRITFRDRIQIGPYRLRAALFLDGSDDKEGD